MDYINTCFGMKASGDDLDSLEWLKEERPFAPVLWHERYMPYKAGKLFTLHIASLMFYELMNTNPMHLLHQLSFNTDDDKMLLKQTQKILELPVGFTKVDDATALLQEWYTAILHKNVYIDATYATQFWMVLHKLEAPIDGTGAVAFKKKQLDILNEISSSFACASGDAVNDIVLFTIVATYMYTHNGQLLIPKINCYREGPCRITSLIDSYVRDAWKVMRYIHEQDFKDVQEEVKKNRFLMDWDGTGLCKCMVDYNNECGKLAGLWARATHRYSFQNN